MISTFVFIIFLYYCVCIELAMHDLAEFK